MSGAVRLALGHLAQRSVELLRKLQQLEEVIEAGRVEILLGRGAAGSARHPKQPSALIAEDLARDASVGLVPSRHELVQDRRRQRQGRPARRFGEPNDKGFQPFHGWNVDAVAGVRANLFKGLYFEFEEKLVYARYFGVKVHEGKARHSVKANEFIWSFGYSLR